MNEKNFTLVTNEVNRYPEEYTGKEITMLGFVFKNQKFSDDQLGLVRYVISCCSADAVVDGFICELAGAADFAKGSWLYIRGTIRMGTYDGEAVPVIKVSSVMTAHEPENLYIYPSFIN